MSEDLSVGIFGCYHADDPEKVEQELSSFRDGGPVFIEMPRTKLYSREQLTRAVQYPLEFLSYLLYSLVQWPLYLYYNRHLLTAEQIAVFNIAENTETDVHPVDESFIMWSRGRFAILLNWLVFGLFIYAAPLKILGVSGALIAVVFVPALLARRWRYPAVGAFTLGMVVFLFLCVVLWSLVLLAFIATGLVTFLVRLHRAQENRNEGMVSRIESISEREGYDRGVLVTGRAHTYGVSNFTKESDLLTLDRIHLSNQTEPGERIESPSLATVAEYENVTLPAESTPEQSGSWIRSLLGRPDPDLRLVSQEPPQTLLRRRLGAGVVDVLLASVVGFLLTAIVADVAGEFGLAGENPTLNEFFNVFVLLSTIYYLPLEWVWGTTVGKRVFGLRVVSDDGTLATVGQILIRNLLRPVDLLTLLAVFLIPGLDTQKRAGDVAAHTVVGKRAKPKEGSVDDYPHLKRAIDRKIIIPGSDQRTAGSRILAGCLDFLPAIVFGLFVIAFWLILHEGVTGVTVYPRQMPSGLFLAGLLVATASYHPTLEMIWGTTPGRRLLKLRVATTRGTTPVGRQLFAKNVLRPVDYILFPVTGLLLLFSNRSQRPSDMVAGTVVGRRQPANANPTEGPATSEDDPIENAPQPDGTL